MASDYTSNYNLCQWAASDKVLRTEFNADNAKIDAALTAKADVSALNALRSTVSSLSGTVSDQGSALDRKGNCVLYTTTYTGNGTYGEANPRSLTFPSKPYLVVIGGDGGFMVLVQGSEGSEMVHNVSYPNTVAWSGNSVSWYHIGSAKSEGMLNRNGYTFQVVALLKAG